MNKRFHLMLVLILIAGLGLPASMSSQAAPPVPVTFTILHTNDFHGQLEASGSNPGLARVAYRANQVRTDVGEGNVLLVDAGDEMQGSLLSNIWLGEPVIAAFNLMGYDAATFGNHEFDWGQDVLGARVEQAEYPYVSANIVVNDTGDCATAGWTSPAFATPYSVVTVGYPVPVNVGFIGVTTQETPYITIAEATQGLCFKDPATSILHYYDELKAQVDVVVVLSHLGYYDGGYGYGFSVYGDQTLASRLNAAGKPANLIIGGHSHTNLSAATMVGSTAVVQAYYNGRRLGRADITVDTDGSVTVAWQSLVIGTSDPQDPAVDALIYEYANDPDYLELVNKPIGYSAVDLPRLGGIADNMMATFVDDAIYNYLNTDGVPENDVDLFFNNAGGIRTDWCWNGTEWVNTGCIEGVHDPALLTYGNMFTILPFGNATVVGEMTGAEILQVLNQGPLVSNGVIQPAGLEYKYYVYKVDHDLNPNTAKLPYGWGAFDYCVVNGITCEPLDLDRTYRVGTNEFLAPAGGDGYAGFKGMENITYWGDMLNAVNAYVIANYGVLETAYKGPNGDGTLDGRITRDGTDDGGSIVPLTILHHNDSHGNLDKGTYVGYTQLVTLINEQRALNPGRTLLLSSGDNIQGDAMMYYFKSAALGYAADGTSLDPALQINPLIAAFNLMGYDAMTLGNHEFNFGNQIFTSSLSQANFPILQANLEDDSSYGIADVPVKDYVEKVVGPEGIKVAILGIGNHRVPNYELPSNIPGLTFTDPIEKAQELSDALRPTNDVVVALTHIGFTEQPGSVEVDNNVDTYMAANVTGLDTIIGGHSHTNPATGFGVYKSLPVYMTSPEGTPVLINQAYRYNNTLGQVVIGVRSDGSGGWDVISQAGRYISVSTTTAEDPTIDTLIQPYVDLLAAYNNTVIGQTTTPIDALQAYTQETNGANLQADAAVWELEDNHSIPVDFHLSGAMSNRKVADGATPESPVTLKVADMFTLMPYENSLVVMEMNGPQLKAVLERAYRNYYYYKYVPGYGGYSYYTTCMIDINAGGQITYLDLYDAAYDPAQEYVVSLVFDGQEVDFDDADTYYRVSTVNYLAAGSCNFNDGGVSLWPLDQIVNDTQFYVRDSVIYYITEMGTVSPVIEGRLQFVSDVTLESLQASLHDMYFDEHVISNWGNFTSLWKSLRSFQSALDKGNLFTAEVILNAFIKKVENMTPKHITPEAAALLIADAQWLLEHLDVLTAAGVDFGVYPTFDWEVSLPIAIR
jgi:2',3'-cyclic-nucleotide 2'-phosphodiesterase (5'-nucleotidase family)